MLCEIADTDVTGAVFLYTDILVRRGVVDLTHDRYIGRVLLIFFSYYTAYYSCLLLVALFIELLFHHNSRECLTADAHLHFRA